jgi:hypothetical protein
MKRSPDLLSRMPPSPRTPSVMSTPAPATPVGWNCQNSMSSSGMPARAAMPTPSPVLMKALVEEGEDAAGTAGGEDGRLGLEERDLAGLHLQRDHADHGAVGVADQVERHPLDEELGVARARCAGRACAACAWPVRSAARRLRCTGFSPKFMRVAAERALVDRAVVVAVERHAEVLELDDDLGAMRHMNSIASWSPSQSDPLTVSYMCQCQLSSLMLPSEAPTPPCAATVCERVGNTLDSTAS